MEKKSYFWISIFVLVFLTGIFFILEFAGITGFVVSSDKLDIQDYKCEDCNVFLIVIDALRQDHLSCYGYSRDTTLNICALADKGILFENAISQSSWTRPGVASILTGLYPKNHGAQNRNNSLSEDKILISEILKENGYKTSAFVTNGNIKSEFGFNQGFDEFIYLKEDKDNVNMHILSDKVNDVIFDSLGDIPLKNNFVYIHYTDTHDPYTPQERFFSSNFSDFFNSSEMDILGKKINGLKNKEEILNQLIDFYDDEILFTDKNIGELVSWMKEKEIYDSSIIIITADHGEEFLEHGKIRHGKTLYDESIKIPLIIHTPEGKSQRLKEQISHVNLIPSILDLINIKSELIFDGTSIFSSFQGETFSELDLDGRKLVSVRANDAKLIFNQINNSFQAFNLVKDTLEKNNIYTPSKGFILEPSLIDYLKNRFSKDENLPDLDKQTLESLKALGYLN